MELSPIKSPAKQRCSPKQLHFRLEGRPLPRDASPLLHALRSKKQIYSHIGSADPHGPNSTELSGAPARFYEKSHNRSPSPHGPASRFFTGYSSIVSASPLRGAILQPEFTGADEEAHAFYRGSQ